MKLTDVDFLLEFMPGQYELSEMPLYIWNGLMDDTTCVYCTAMIYSGKLYTLEDEIPECPAHHNCRCWYEEV